MATNATRARVADLIAAGDLVINDGYRAKNSELSNDGLPFARAQNIINGFRFENADRFPKEHPRDELHSFRLNMATSVLSLQSLALANTAATKPDFCTPFVHQPGLISGCFRMTLVRLFGLSKGF